MSQPRSRRENPQPELAERSVAPAWLAWCGLGFLIAFCVFFFQFTLPNSNPPVSRGDLWQILPTWYFDLLFPPVRKSEPPHGWHYLPQRFDLMFVAGVIWLFAAAVGRLVLRGLRLDAAMTRAERIVFSCGLGLAVASLFTLAAGLAGMLHRGLFVSCIIAAVLGELLCRWRLRAKSAEAATTQTTGPALSLEFRTLCVVAILPFLLAMLLGALLPSTDFDVKEYHLQGPKEFFQNGRVTMLPHNVYTSFPFLTEMLSLCAMVLRGDWFRGALAGKAVLMGFAPLTALALYAAGKRWFGEAAGWFAAVIHLSTPWTYRISIIAYAEGGLTFFLFASLLAVTIAVEQAKTQHGTRFFLLSGLLAGSAMACKYPGVLQVVIPLGLVAAGFPFVLSREEAMDWKAIGRRAGVYALGTLLAIGPWLLKNAIETGNPVYPLLWTVFGGDDWDAELNAKWRAGHSPDNHDPRDLAVKFVDVVAKSDWQSPLLFGLAPLAFLWRDRRRLVGWLWAYVGFLFLAWWVFTHRIDRFWVPMIPVIALLAGVGAAAILRVPRLRIAAGACLAAMLVFNLMFITTPLCGNNEYLSELDDARLRSESTSTAVAFMNRKLPAEAKVLCVGEAQVFDLRRAVVYNTVFDRSIFQDWAGESLPDTPPRDWPLKSPADIRRKLREEGITHICVNWQEILRYRGTYGYTEFVSPGRFLQLEKSGVLAAPLETPPEISLVPWDGLSERDRKDILQWGPELQHEFRGTKVFVRFQVFPVRAEP